MAVAMRGTHFSATHAVRELLHVGWINRLGEGRPAAPGVELVGRSEQRLARHDVDVDTRLFVVQIFSTSGAFRRALLRYAILLRGKPGDGVWVLSVGWHLLLLVTGTWRPYFFIRGQD